jgi:guanine nucleotide-binding protein subunit alpha
MRIIHDGGFPLEERRSNRSVIYSNMIVAFKVLLEIMSKEGIDFEKEETMVSLPTRIMSGFTWKLMKFPKKYADIIEKEDGDVDADEAFSNDQVRVAMKEMWLDAGIQKAVAKGHEFALHDNLN